MDRNNWTEKQERIFNGLSAIGLEIAGFYETGLSIYFKNNVFPNSAYLLLHTAREIDGGLRDILAIDFSPNKEEDEKHKKSILFSLDLKEFDRLAENWFEVSKKLHKYAHRHGAWKPPRQLEEVIPIWEEFENILDRLVGSYYAIIGHIEHIGKTSKLGKAVVETLSNILMVPTFYEFFFQNEKSVKWFIPLKEKGFFSPTQVKFDKQNIATYWNALDYLELISKEVVQNPIFGWHLIEIIENIVQFSLNTKRINNYHIWWYCIKILNNIPLNIIKNNIEVDKFRSWLIVFLDHCPGSGLTISDIGEKLLPKFLNDDAKIDKRYEYAEILIDLITEIKKGERSTSLRNQEIAVFRWDSYWIEESIHKNSKQIGEKCGIELIFILSEKLKNALNYKQKKHHVILEKGDDIYRIEVSRIPSSLKKSDKIDFKKYKYQCVFSKFSEKQLKGKDRNEIYWKYELRPQIELKKINFVAIKKVDFVSSIVKKMPRDIPWENNDDLTKKISYIFDDLFSDYSGIWFKSLVGSSGEHYYNAEEKLIVILRDILLAKCEFNKGEGKKVLSGFLSDEFLFPIFKRLVLLCIDKFWKDYSILWDEFFTLIPDAFEKSEFEVELYDILFNHNRSFNDHFTGGIKKIINNVPTYYIEKDEDRSFYWKFKWLSPLRDHPDFKALFEEMKQNVDPKNGKPYEPERSTFRSSYVVHHSPLPKEDILQKPVSELIEYLKEFKGADQREATFEDKPDKNGLANALEESVKDNPKKFTSEINNFINTDRLYLTRIFRGLKDVWQEGKDLDWEKILSFGEKYFSQNKNAILKEAFQTKGEVSSEGRYIWIVTDFMDLIAEGCKDDKHAFDPRYFDLVEEIFSLVLPLLKIEKHPDIQNNALSYAMNTTFGRTIMSFITYSLRKARATQKKENDWWKSRYDQFFERGIEAYIWFGGYLPQMKYLDEEYTKNKIELLSKKSLVDFEWKMFMEGYLMGTKIYKDLFKDMYSNYKIGLENNAFNEQVDQRLVEHICIGYLQIDEKLEIQNDDGRDSLFWFMLMHIDKERKWNRWLYMVDFFWSQTGRTLKREEINKEKLISREIINKILQFWEWSVQNQELVKSILGESYNPFLGKLAELTILLDRIDDKTEKWLLLSAPHIGHQHSISFFIEYLTKFDDAESIRRIGKIFLKMLEKSTSTFDPENIKIIVRRIYERGERDDADEICNTYGRRGNHLLKPLWEEFQKKPESE